MSDLKAKGIGCGIYYNPVHMEPAYRELGHADGELPVTEKLCSSILSVPIFYGMKDEECMEVCREIKSFMKVS